MRRTDWILIVVAVATAWGASALTAEGVYTGDTAPPGTTVPSVIGALMLLVLPVVLGAYWGRRLYWGLRVALYLGIALLLDVVATWSYADHVFHSATCTGCDTAVIFATPFFSVVIGAWSVLGGLVGVAGGRLRQRSGTTVQ
jgi:hypothetical protein